MSEFGQNIRNLVKKGIEAIGSTAENLASSTKQKVEEFNLSNQIQEIYAQIGSKVCEMYKKGVEFPSDLAEDLHRASEAEKELELLKDKKDLSEENGSHEESVQSTLEENTPSFSDEQTAAVDYASNDDHDIPVIRVDESTEAEEDRIPENTPLSSAINDLFENMPPVDKMVEKVNSSLDDLGDSLRKFSGDFDKQLNDFADQMMGKNDKE